MDGTAKAAEATFVNQWVGAAGGIVGSSPWACGHRPVCGRNEGVRGITRHATGQAGPRTVVSQNDRSIRSRQAMVIHGSVGQSKPAGAGKPVTLPKPDTAFGATDGSGVDARVRSLVREHVPASQRAASSAPGTVVQEPVVAPVTAELSLRESALLLACYRGNVAKVKRLLKYGHVDVNSDNSGPFLCFAAFRGQTAVVRHLLSVPRIDVNHAFPGGVTPLYFAAQQRRVEIVRRLLAVRGIDVNAATDENATPLMVATEEGHADVVKMLLAVPGIKVNCPTLEEHITPLYIASERGHVDVVRLLLDAPDIDIEMRSAVGATPLFVAAQQGFPAVVEELARRGANVNTTFSTGVTPLCKAVERGHVQVVRTLLRSPAIAVNQAREDCVTALSVAAHGGHEGIVRLLIRKGADPNTGNASVLTPLQHACIRGHTAVVRMLLDAGAFVDATFESEGRKYTPYGLAELGGRREVMYLLAAHRGSRQHALPRLESLSKADGFEWSTPPTTPPPEWSTPATTPPPEWTTPPTTPPPEWFAPSTPMPCALPEPPGEPSSVPRCGRHALAGVPADATPAVAAAESRSPVALGSRPNRAETPSPLAQVKDALRREVLGKLEDDNLEPLEGVRLLEEVNASTDIDGLCSLYNRMARTERQKEQARRRVRRRERFSVIPGAPQARPRPGTPVFTLGGKSGLDADGVEDEIRQHLDQAYHRFVCQAVNDMAFGRGKATPGYRGVWHASAGIAGVGSCSLFYSSNEETQRIGIVGIGHHVGSAAYRLEYASGELGGPGRILRLA